MKSAASWQNQQNDLCAQRSRSDQPGHPQPGYPPSLINLRCALSGYSWGPNVSSCGQRRLWSDWADTYADLSLRWAQRSFCWFCHEVAQISLVTKQNQIWTVIKVRQYYSRRTKVFVTTWCCRLNQCISRTFIKFTVAKLLRALLQNLHGLKANWK